MFTCRSHDRVQFIASEISRGMYPIPSDRSQGPFYFVGCITESYFILSDRSQRSFYIVDHDWTSTGRQICASSEMREQAELVPYRLTLTVKGQCKCSCTHP